MSSQTPISRRAFLKSLTMATGVAAIPTLLAACGNAPSTPASAPTSVAPAAATSAPAAAASASVTAISAPAATTAASTAATSAPAVSTGQQVTLKYVTWIPEPATADPALVQGDRAMLNLFEAQNPGIKVESTVLEGAKYDQLLRPRILAGDVPDALLMQASTFATMLSEKRLLDVSNESGTTAIKNTPFLAKFYGPDGPIYAALVNGSANNFPFFYNKPTFDKLGVRPPSTMDEFMALCEKIKVGGLEAVVFGGKDLWPFQTLSLPYANAEALARVSNVDMALAKGELTASDYFGGYLTFFENMVKQGYIGKSTQTLTFPQSAQYFAEGKAATLPQGPWVPTMDEIKAVPSLQLATFAFPHPADSDGKIRLIATADRSLGISATTQHPDEAKALYNFFLDPANLGRYLTDQSLVTLTPGVNPTISSVLSDFYTSMNDTSRYTLSMPSSKVSIPAGFTNETNQSQINILAGATAEEEAARLNEEFDKVKGQIKISE